MHTYDVLIAGGGLVGVGLAAALRHTPLRVALIDAASRDSEQPAGRSAAARTARDDRSLALSPASRRILSGISLWDELATQTTPILHVHISERGRFGATRISAQTLGMPALAHVVPAERLGAVFLRALNEHPRCDLFCPAAVTELHRLPDHVEVIARQGNKHHELRSRLLVVADGTPSPALRLLGVKVRERDYGQTAIVASVTPSRPHRNVAYERFTSTGPVALLPQAEGRCGLVYVAPTAAAVGLLAANDADFLGQVQARFGNRLGALAALGRRSDYPLRLSVPERIAGERYVVIGNAAHAIHPNAAQGLNLGLRDVAVLAELLHDAAHADEEVGAARLTESYAQHRGVDHRRTVRFSDGLARLFYNDRLPLVLLRQAGMLAIDFLPPLKRALVRTGSGLRGPAPRLVQGLAL
jgi:2-octaprenyl-6-methoxyphenol hydroxylase